MNKKRIILVRNAQPYDFGGGERFTVFLAEELLKLGHQPIILSRHAKMLEFADDNHIQSYRSLWWSNQSWNGWRVLFFPAYFLWQTVLFLHYIILFVLLRADVIHLHSKDDFIAGTLAGAALYKRVIWTDHADLKHVWENIHVWYKNPIGKLVYYCAKLTDHITCVSDSEKRLVAKRLREDDSLLNKLSVVYNGVADSYIAQPGPTARETFTFCIAGRLVHDKGIREAIEAFKIFHSEHKDSRLVLVGDGADRLKYEKSAVGIPVTFLGHQTNPLAYMADTDVYLHPTYHEGFSVSLIEATMLKLPIIATNVGGNPEIIHDSVTGILIPVKDSGALYKAMERLYNDAELRKELAEAARKQYVETFQFCDIVQNNFIPLYNGTYEDSR